MNKKNILFVKVMPEYLSLGYHLPPLGLLYLSSNLKNSDKFNKKLFDAGIYETSTEAEHNFKLILKKFKPDIVTISVLTPAHNMLMDFSKITKQWNSHCIVIAGGPHISVFGQKLKNENIDFLIKGEAENTFSDLINSIINKTIDYNIPGLIYEKNNKIFENQQSPFIEDLDSIKLPDWNLVDFKKYKKFHGFAHIFNKKPIAPIMSSRACPFNCTYCHRLFGQNYKTRSPENVIKEIKELYFKYGVKEIQFIDDVFNLDLERAKKILSMIIDLKIDISLSFPNGIVPVSDDSFLDLLKKAGTYYVSYAPEAGDARIRNFIKKGSNLKQITKAINKTIEKGIFVNGFFMIGFPTETKKEIEKTIQFALNSRLHTACFFTVVPFPNTELAEIAGISVDTPINMLHYFSNVSFTEHISANDLIEIKKNAYKRFYVNLKRAIRIIWALPSRYKCGKGTYDIASNLFQKLFFGHHNRK